mgnify:CR=1
MANLRAVHHNVAPKCNRIRGDRPIETVMAELATIIGHPNDWDW